MNMFNKETQKEIGWSAGAAVVSIAFLAAISFIVRYL